METTDISSDPDCCRIINTDMAIDSSPDIEDGHRTQNTGHSDQPGLGSNLTLDTHMTTDCGLDSEPPCGFWQQHGPQFNTDTYCSRTMDPGMILGNIQGLYVTIAPGGSGT